MYHDDTSGLIENSETPKRLAQVIHVPKSELPVRHFPKSSSCDASVVQIDCSGILCTGVAGGFLCNLICSGIPNTNLLVSASGDEGVTVTVKGD